MFVFWKRHALVSLFTHARSSLSGSNEGGALPILWLLARRPQANLIPVVHALTVAPKLLPAMEMSS